MFCIIICYLHIIIGKSYSLKMPSNNRNWKELLTSNTSEYGRGMCKSGKVVDPYGNRDHKAGGSRVEKLEEMQRRNEHIRGTTRVAQVSKKITGRRLNWYGHVMRRDGIGVGGRSRKRLKKTQEIQQAQLGSSGSTEESVEGRYTREKEERTTENKITKMERRVSTIFEK